MAKVTGIGVNLVIGGVSEAMDAAAAAANQMTTALKGLEYTIAKQSVSKKSDGTLVLETSGTVTKVDVTNMQDVGYTSDNTTSVGGQWQVVGPYETALNWEPLLTDSVPVPVMPTSFGHFLGLDPIMGCSNEALVDLIQRAQRALAARGAAVPVEPTLVPTVETSSDRQITIRESVRS